MVEINEAALESAMHVFDTAIGWYNYKALLLEFLATYLTSAKIDGITRERDEARAALKDCVDNLESELKGRYDGTLDYPSEIRRFERDIAP